MITIDRLHTPAAEKFCRELSEECEHSEAEWNGGGDHAFHTSKRECFICTETLICRAIAYGMALGRGEARMDETHLSRGQAGDAADHPGGDPG